MIDHTTYLNIAYQIASESKCNRRKVGAILVKDGNILSIGYNGTPHGFDNDCEEKGISKQLVLHAESNAITKCAKSTYTCEGAYLYLTLSPCFECCKLIIQAGIKKVFFRERYTDLTGLEILKQANIEYHEI